LNDRPAISTPGTQYFHEGNMKMKFHGKVAWIYNDLFHIFNGLITKAVNDLAPMIVNSAVNNKIRNKLLGMNINLPIGKYFDLNIGLNQAPYYSPDLKYFTMGLSGELTDRAKPGSRCPLSPARLPGSLNNDEVQIYLDDYVIDCALIVLYNRGLFNHLVTPQNVPPNQKKYLNTSEYWLLLPPLYSQFPNLNMQIDFQAAKSPKTIFTPGSLSASLEATATFSVINKGQIKQVFVLDVIIYTGLYINFRPGNVIWGNVTSSKCNFTVKSSNIGPLSIVPLVNLFLGPACSHYIPEIVNFVLNEGLWLPPIFGFSLQNPVFGYGNGWAGFSSSVKYT